MLPEYVCPQLTSERLDGFIMRSALEAEEFPVSVETARNACIQYMSHSAVRNEELNAFEKELRQDSCFDNIPAFDAIAALSETVGLYLRQGEEFDYRMKQLRLSNTEAAMKKAEISCHETFVEVLLAALVVSGRTHMEKECQAVLEAAGITTADVFRIAECYEP